MKTPISRSALELVYEHALAPFFYELARMMEDFKSMFSVVELPDIGLELLDRLDSNFYYGCWEFCTQKSLNFELHVALHFNQYDYEIELYLETCNYTKKLQFSYDALFPKEKQVAISHEIGRLIIATIKEKHR